MISARITILRSGFTLIELLVSITLGMMLIALAWSAFVKTKDAAARTSKRIELHTSASIYRELLQRDFANLSPATAFFTRSTPRVVSGTDEIDTLDVVFMRTIAPLRTQHDEGIDQEFMADYHWVRWRFKRTWRQISGKWTVMDHTLYRSHSSPSRRWFTDRAIVGAPFSVYDPAADVTQPAGGVDNWGLAYLNLPRPIRDASAGIAALDFNTYGTPAALNRDRGSHMADIGDLTDLDRNDQVSSTRVRDFMVGWVDAGGTMVSVSSDTAADYRLNGLHMDVVGPSGNPYKTQLARLPRIIRITMNLAEGGVSQDFSFSIATPGLAPQFRP